MVMRTQGSSCAGSCKRRRRRRRGGGARQPLRREILAQSLQQTTHARSVSLCVVPVQTVTVRPNGRVRVGVG